MRPALTTLSEDEIQFRDAVRTFAENEIKPHVHDMDQKGEMKPEIVKKLFSPRLNMPLEKAAIFMRLGVHAAQDQPSHSLKQEADMIFRFGVTFAALQPQALQILPHTYKRALIEKTGQIIRGVGEKLSAPNAHKQIEMLFGDGAGKANVCRSTNCAHGAPQRGFITLEL